MKEGFTLKKVLALILITGLLVVAVTGCGMLQKAKDFKEGLDDIGDIVDDIGDDIGDDVDDVFDDDDEDDEYTDDEDDDDEDTEEALFDGNVYYPEDCFAVFDKFQEFGYTWTSIDSEGASYQWSVYYVSEGTEDVDGVEAEVFSALHTDDGDTTEYKYWFDEEWDCIKATVDGEENNDWGAAALTMSIQTYVNYVLLTQPVIDEDGLLQTFSYHLEDERSESSDVGDMDVYELSSVFSPVTITYGLTEIDGEMIFVMIKNDTNDSPASEELMVTHAVPR